MFRVREDAVNLRASADVNGSVRRDGFTPMIPVSTLRKDNPVGGCAEAAAEIQATSARRSVPMLSRPNQNIGKSKLELLGVLRLLKGCLICGDIGNLSRFPRRESRLANDTSRHRTPLALPE
jgi:hypothetical protein